MTLSYPDEEEDAAAAAAAAAAAPALDAWKKLEPEVSSEAVAVTSRSWTRLRRITFSQSEDDADDGPAWSPSEVDLKKLDPDVPDTVYPEAVPSYS